MDALDTYKKAWNKQQGNFNKISKKEIYKLAHAKSSSIVKWIFIIGILEFIFWTGINICIPDSFYNVYEELDLMGFLNVFMVLHYIIIVIFLYVFYNNHQRVSLTESTKKLMNNILRIRKTVKYYVIYNLATVFLTSIIINVVLFSDADKLMEIMNPSSLNVSINQIITITIISQIIALIIILALLWFFYRLVYGILLKKLKKNYKELANLED